MEAGSIRPRWPSVSSHGSAWEKGASEALMNSGEKRPFGASPRIRTHHRSDGRLPSPNLGKNSTTKRDCFYNSNVPDL